MAFKLSSRSKKKLDGVRLTIPPVFYQNRASNYIDYALLRNGFKYLKREVTSSLFIENNVNILSK